MVKIIALGSSFAAGPGIPPLASRQTLRSTINYPPLIASRLGASLVDLTVSGATLLNLLNTPQGMFGSLPPQVEGVTSDADLVTITGGGNDLGYIGGMMRDSFRTTMLGSMVAWMMLPILQPDTVPKEDEVVERFRKVIDAVRERAPKARILLVEYITILGSDVRPGVNVPLNEEQVAHYREIAQTVQRIYARAAEGKERCEVIAVADLSEAHGVGSEDPWCTGHGWGGFVGGEMSYHPNKRGMEAVADIIHVKLKKDGLAGND